jgi:hypothetical protein
MNEAAGSNIVKKYIANEECFLKIVWDIVESYFSWSVQVPGALRGRLRPARPPLLLLRHPRNHPRRLGLLQPVLPGRLRLVRLGSVDGLLSHVRLEVVEDEA